MANQKFKDTLLSVLKADERVWKDGEFNQTRLFNLVDKHDAVLLKLLIDNEELKEKFFVKVNDIFIFKGQDFKFYLDENKLDNSYTQFENIIGLKVGNKMLKDRDEVVLNFPFKDCVLQGGQSRDEGLDVGYEYDEKLGDYTEIEAKRKEVFFNEILAKDEIDRLEAPKVLKNWKRYTKDGEVPVGKLKRDEDGVIKENLIIKGNNLLALHSIKKEFAGKVKLIYIDPPYNTKSDSFKYNDNFNHSTWLTFMKNRLEVVYELLSDDGAIFIQCDDNEQAYLKVLMDGVFGSDQFVNVVAVKMNESKGLKNAHIEKKLPKSKEYLLIYSKIKGGFQYIPQKIDKDKEELLGYVKYYNKYIPNINESIDKWIIKEYEKGNVYEEKLKDKNSLIYLVSPDNDININLDTGKFGVIKNNRDKNNVYFNDNGNILKVLFLGENTTKFVGDLWLDISTININKESGVETLSNGQKPEKLIERIINLSTRKGDIVLDYHLGSGTTAAVAHKMGRQYLGIEQMEYIERIALERLKKTIAGEQGGISGAVNWQGGGEFVYFELAQWNEEAKQKIHTANSIEELESLFDTMYERYFLNYNVKVKEFKEKVLTDAKFRSLPLDRQKDMFIRMLDLNQMYVNFTERNDKKFSISGDDISLSEEFYKN